MGQNDILRQYRDFVVLGLPRDPLAFLINFYRSNKCRPHIFLSRCPLWLRLLPLAKVHQSAARRRREILLLELSDFAEQNIEKVLTLIPCTPDAITFVAGNRDSLEASYTIKYRKNPTEVQHDAL